MREITLAKHVEFSLCVSSEQGTGLEMQQVGADLLQEEGVEGTAQAAPCTEQQDLLEKAVYYLLLYFAVSLQAHILATNKSDKGLEVDCPFQIPTSQLCLGLWRQ